MLRRPSLGRPSTRAEGRHDRAAIYLTPKAAQLHGGITELRIHVIINPQTLELEFPPYIDALSSVLSREEYEAYIDDVRAKTAPYRFKPEHMAAAAVATCCCCLGCPCYIYYTRQIVKGFESFTLTTQQKASTWRSARPVALASEQAQPQVDSPDYRGYDELGLPYRRVMIKRGAERNEYQMESVSAWPPSGLNIIVYAHGTEVQEAWPRLTVEPQVAAIRRV
jgi:hypothetical protein